MAMLRHWTPSTVSRAFTPASVEAVPLKATARRGPGALRRPAPAGGDRWVHVR